MEKFFFKTDNCGMRLLKDEDVAGNYYNWFNDGDVCAFNSHFRFPKTKDELVEYIHEINSNRNNLVFAIIEQRSQTHIGNISLQEINYIDRSAELAFLIGEKEYWGKGYAAEAAEVLIDHAFNRLNLHRLYCGTADNNIRMQKLAEKLGFMKEGIRRQALFENGVYHDIIEYGKLREECTKCK